MKIEEFKILEEKIKNQDFNRGYKTINTAMTFLSYFCHVSSIFLAFFILSKIISGAMGDYPVAVFISSVIILSGIELLKRDIFQKFSTMYIKLKAFKKDLMPLFLLSIAIISISFYASISGAKEFSSKTKEIEVETKETITNYKDSLAIFYEDKVKLVEYEIKNTKSKLEYKDKEQTDLESIQPPTRSAKQRIKDLKEEKVTLRSDVTKLEGDIVKIKGELVTIVKQKEVEIGTESEDRKKDNSSNSLAFVLISTLIEIVILAGVFFNEYYKFRSYREFRDKIEKDPNYQKWMLYDQMLYIIYTEDTKMNQKLPPNKTIIDICGVNDIIVMPKDIINFLKVINSLGIIKTSGSVRYINKQRDLSFLVLRKNFNIE